jgi:hypothetical protein
MSVLVKNLTKRFGTFAAWRTSASRSPEASSSPCSVRRDPARRRSSRIIAGLETADSGSVLYHDEDVTAARCAIATSASSSSTTRSSGT